MDDRKTLLICLVKGSSEPTEIQKALRAFSWDSNCTLIELTRVHLDHVLSRYLHGEIDAHWLEAWANAIESREDIGFEPGYEDQLQDVIYQLANPLLTSPITVKHVAELKQRLFF